MRAKKRSKNMDRETAVMQCVAEMRKLPRFSAAPDHEKAKAAAFAFDRLHEDAVEHLPFGCSGEDLKHYAKAATRRVHEKLTATYKTKAATDQFEQVNGFPFLMVLGLIPLLWNWWKLLKEWMGW